jgi:hypothetical protein
MVWRRTQSDANHSPPNSLLTGIKYVSLKTRDVSLAGAVLGFAEDSQVIFDVSIDDEGTKA